jgi:hypothetical protein
MSFNCPRCRTARLEERHLAFDHRSRRSVAFAWFCPTCQQIISLRELTRALGLDRTKVTKKRTRREKKLIELEARQRQGA